MKYLVLCYYDVKQFESLSQERREAMMADCQARDVEFMRTQGVDCVGSQSDSKTWKCIRGMRDDGKPELSTGPWRQAQEQVGAFFIVDAKDMDQALAVALKHPGPHVVRYCGGGLEIRACDYYAEPNNAVVEGAYPAAASK